MKPHVFARFLLLVLFATPTVQSQTNGLSPQWTLTSADSQRMEKMLARNLLPKVKNAFIVPHWIGTSDEFWYRRQTSSGTEFVVVDAAAGSRRPAFDHQAMAAAVSKATGTTVTSDHLPFEAIEFNQNRSSIGIVVGNRQYNCVLKPAACSGGSPIPPDPLDVTIATEPPPPVTDPSEGLLISPDKQWAVLTKDNNLWMQDMHTGQQHQLTRDGQPNCGYGIYVGIWNTASIPRDHMIEAGHHLPPMASFWSPDSRTVIVPHVDQRNVADYPFVESVPTDGSFRPQLHLARIPLAGEKPALLEWYIFEALSGKYRRINFPYDKMLMSDSDSLELRSRWWSSDARHLYVLYRGLFKQSAFFFDVDVATGNVRTVIDEQLLPRMDLAPSFVDDPVVWTGANGKDIIWYSFRDGWGHLYLYDGQTGRLRNQITRGEWLVHAIVKVDEPKRVIYFTAAGKEGGNPYYRYLYRVNFDGSDLRLLSPEPADHLIGRIAPLNNPPKVETISPSGKYAVYNFSTPQQPPQAVIRSTADGRLIATVEKADVTELWATGYKPPEEFVARSADGKYDLWCLIYKPTDFDPQKRYPVIDTEYAATITSAVPRNFMEAIRGAPGGTDPALVELGFVAVAIDGRGTPNRSHDFWLASYGKMNINGLDDHVAAIQQMGKRFPYMDLDRVGIMGQSFGGWSAIWAMLDFPDFFKVGVAGIPAAIGHSLYPIMEDYQGPPVYSDGSHWRPRPNEVPENWKAIDGRAKAGDLKGHLLMFVGEDDENDLSGSVLQFVDALMAADKNFDLIYMPSANHAARFSHPQYAIRRMYDYMVHYLQPGH
ncbi:MAG TPA: DPP IV N-terminal domain-containing protein [Candidatus Angelobacter sp.]